MVILVVLNSFNVVKNLKKPDLVARQKPPLYTTVIHIRNLKQALNYGLVLEKMLRIMFFLLYGIAHSLWASSFALALF